MSMSMSMKYSYSANSRKSNLRRWAIKLKSFPLTQSLLTNEIASRAYRLCFVRIADLQTADLRLDSGTRRPMTKYSFISSDSDWLCDNTHWEKWNAWWPWCWHISFLPHIFWRSHWGAWPPCPSPSKYATGRMWHRSMTSIDLEIIKSCLFVT